MIPAPIALARQTVNAYARYSDADVYLLPPGTRAEFFERAQALFKKLVIFISHSWLQGTTQSGCPDCNNLTGGHCGRHPFRPITYPGRTIP